jgi:NitT/TauT family transport system ATP-binding protein
MSARPGRITTVVDIDLDAGGASALRDGEVDVAVDVRSTPAFAHHRHEVWRLLQQEVLASTRHAQEVATVG